MSGDKTPILLTVMLIIGLVIGLEFNRLWNVNSAATVTQTIYTTVTSTATINTTLTHYYTTETYKDISSVIIFRVDDVSAGWYPRVTKNITMTFILKGVPLTLALVPTGGRGTIADDEEMVTFLRTVSSNKRLIEIAQHGWNHSNRPPNGEFRGRPFIDQYNDIKNGKSILDNAFYNYNGNVSTFTVTYNVYDENTVKAAAHLGFTVFSSKLLMDWWDSFVTPPYQHNRFDENGLLYLDWNVLFLDENSREPYPVTVTTTNCKTMLKLFGVCIILLHIQDFRKGSEDVVDERKYTVLLELINELRKIPNVLFTTMREYYAIRKALVE